VKGTKKESVARRRLHNLLGKMKQMWLIHAHTLYRTLVIRDLPKMTGIITKEETK